MPSSDRSPRSPPSLGHVRPDRWEDAAHPSRLGSASAPTPAALSSIAPFSLHREHARRPSPRTRRGRAAVYVFLAFVALIAIGVGVLVAMPPVEMVRAHIAAELERQTGRKVGIREAGVSFASGLGVSLGGITISAPGEASDAPILVVERMEVALALFPLVVGEVRIDRLTLLRPVLDLRIDPTGRRNWDFAAGPVQPADKPLRYAQARGSATDSERLPPELLEFVRNGSAPGSSTGVARRVPEGLSLADVRIVSGRVRYEDARSAFVRDLQGVNAVLSLPSVAGALSIRGEFALGGERLALDARVDQLQELLAGRQVTSRFRLEGGSVDAGYEGKLGNVAPPVGEGRIQIKAASASALSRLLELPLTGLEQLGTVSLDGHIRVTSGALVISSATYAAGGTHGTGTIGFEIGLERPKLTANLRLAAVDADQLSAISVAPSLPSPPPAATSGSVGRFALPSARPDSGAPKSIDDLIGRDDPSASRSPATRVHGFRMRAGNQWDVDPLDSSAFRIIDADARLQIGALKFGRLTAANILAGVELKAGVMRVSITDGQLAGGAIRGLVSIDARQPAVTVGANISGDNVALKPILDAAGIDPFEGRGRFIVAVSAQGSSERELVSTLAGRAELKIADGALLGWDAEAIVNGLAQGKMPPAHRQPGARTPFKELSATFQIAHGVARSRDIKLESSALGAGGTGTINIVDRNIDLLLKPRVAAGGLEIPVRIAGNWNDPTAVADVAGALKSPQAQEAARQLKEGNVEGALRSVLGNGPKADEKIGKAKEALRGLLGR